MKNLMRMALLRRTEFAAYAFAASLSLLSIEVHPAEPAAADRSPIPPQVWKLDGGAQITATGAITLGTIRRAQGRSADLLPPGNAARVGASGTAPAGSNVDDGNLNYDKGDAVSTAIKGLFDLELRQGDFRAFLRARAWDDWAQRRDDVPHGNPPNGYTANTPLSDSGFTRYGKFSNAVLMDAYVEHTFTALERPLLVRLGSQAIDWGRTDLSILGGLEQINAIDYPARYRAGALPQEGYVPVPAVFARWGDPATTAVEAFYLFKFQENESAVCGTFFALADYTATGCNIVVAQPAGTTDPAAIAAGILSRRGPDGMPGDGGQYGIGATHTAGDLGRFGIYFANYHSRRFSASAIKSTRIGAAPLIPGDPGGDNVRYFIEYPDDVRVFGLNFGKRVTDGRWKGAGFYAEYTYRPNQSVLLSPTDLFNAFASNTAPSQLRADAAATAPGAKYPGYDRRKISQFTAAMSAPLGKVFEGSLSIGLEAGFKYIHDLPDVNVRRYVRSEVFGLGPVNGACIAGASDRQCSSEGYVTPFSWGYRAKLAARFANLIDDVTLTPSVAFAHDVNGYAHDVIFIEGRKASALALRADITRNFYAEASWWSVWGGKYNFSKDRDYYTFVAGIKF